MHLIHMNRTIDSTENFENIQSRSVPYIYLCIYKEICEFI